MYSWQSHADMDNGRKHSCCSNEDLGAITRTLTPPTSHPSWYYRPKTRERALSSLEIVYEMRWPDFGEPFRIDGRILDYVWELTDFTCDLGWFVSRETSAMELARGKIVEVGPNHTLYSSHTMAWHRLTQRQYKYAFSPSKHHHRLAILGLPRNTHIALVPATSRQGDFVVSIHPEVLPLVLRSCARTFDDSYSCYKNAKIERRASNEHSLSLEKEVVNSLRAGLGKVTKYQDDFEFHAPAFVHLQQEAGAGKTHSDGKIESHKHRDQAQWFSEVKSHLQRFVIY